MHKSADTTTGNVLGREISSAVAALERQERAYREQRERSDRIIAECGKAMQLMHAGRLDDAERILSGVRTSLQGIVRVQCPVAEAEPAFGNAEDASQQGLAAEVAGADVALQEYAEAEILLAVMRGGELPARKSLGVGDAHYLLGLADVLGELRREIIEHMRKDDYATAVRMFSLMEGIYELLLPVRISNSILPGFRRKLDVARSMVEQCRRDILMYKISKGL
ncbi:MAG: hypothetical protein N3H30_01800 [Candidatus Micrarchaeota archaeon]|nr:hypothetical protein [Candidatus Micrarchaeota archaeon]